MPRLIVRHSDYDWFEDRDSFIRFCRAHRARFAPGAEVEVEFVGRNVHDGFAMARLAAQVYSGMLDAPSTPFVSKMGPFQGHCLGSQSPDGTRGWRIDWDPTFQFHINWWDHGGDVARRNRAGHFYGANIIAGGTMADFGEKASHFPGQLLPKKK